MSKQYRSVLKRNISMNVVGKIKTWLRHRKLYVIADSRDNSISLSKSLFEEMGGYDMKCDKVIVFKVGTQYAFTNQHGISEEGNTATFPIQYNEKYKTIGFECAVPGLNRIFYDYGLPAYVQLKLSVEVKEQPVGQVEGMKYYVLVPPSSRIKKNLLKALTNDKRN